MSFSFTVKAPTREKLFALACEEMGKVVALQPAHEHDEELVSGTLGAYIAMLEDAEDVEFTLSVSGSLGWVYKAQPESADGEPDPLVFTAASLSLSVYRTAVEAPKEAA